MKHILPLSFYLFCLFSSQMLNASGIPKTMPDDFTINYHSYIGHNPTYLGIDLSLTKCSAMLHERELPLISFVITKEELSSLYNALFSLKAFTLKSQVTKYRDRGGERIDYTIAGKKYIVDNYGPRLVTKKQTDHLIESIDLITAFADRHSH